MPQKVNAVLAVLLIGVIAAIPLSGVKESFSVQSLENSAVVKSVGLDAGEQARLSFVQSMIDGTSAKHTQAVVSAQAGSFAAAEKQAQILADKYLSLSYTKHIIFGMPTAKTGLCSALNFLLSSPILQLSSCIYICEGEAQKILEKISADDISTDEVLTNLNLAGQQEGYYYPVTVLDLAKSESENTCLCVPIIGEKKEGKNTAKNTVLVFRGYAVLKGGKMLCTLDKECSRAYNLLAGRLKKTVAEGETADVKVERAAVKTRVEFRNKQVKTVHFEVSLRLRAADLKAGNLKGDAAAACREQAEQTFLAETQRLFECIKQTHLDILGLRHEAAVQNFGTFAVPEQSVFDADYKVIFHAATDRSYPLDRSV